MTVDRKALFFQRRQQAVGDLVEDIITREELVLTLKEVTDLERLIGRVVYGTAGGRDMASLRVHMATLRKKLEKNQDTQYIQTHIGIGYRMLKNK